MDTRVEITIQRVEERLHTRIDAHGLAEGVGLSASRLSRLFRDAVGMTPTAYLRARRMLRARILIERTTLTVSEVMVQVGLSDPSHFARDFRNVHGFSPRTLRRQLRMSGGSSRYLTLDPTG